MESCIMPFGFNFLKTYLGDEKGASVLPSICVLYLLNSSSFIST
jgi:hypothetical protein